MSLDLLPDQPSIDLSKQDQGRSDFSSSAPYPQRAVNVRFLSLGPWNDTCAGLTAPVERGPSQGARSGSKRSARVSFHCPLFRFIDSLQSIP